LTLTWVFNGSASAAYRAKPEDRIGFWCKGAAQFQILRGQTAALDKLSGQQFDNIADGQTVASLFPEYDVNPELDGTNKGRFTEVERNSRTGIDPKSLLPGDQTWVQNPKGEGTEAGSNKFYIGRGQFADPYIPGPFFGNDTGNVLIQNYGGYLNFVHREAGNPDRATLKINRVARPIVPNYK
jgi:hypothetical protein